MTTTATTRVQHTPGEYIYDPDDDFHNVGENAYVVDENLVTLAVFEGDQRRGNAALFAAAPALLRFAEQFEAARDSGVFRRDPQGVAALSAAARKVIAQVSGE